MHSRLALRPDLVENALEERALLAAFLESTYFQYNFGSGTSPFEYSAGAISLTMTDAGAPFGFGGLDNGGATGTGVYASNFAAGSSYLGFGSNPFGAGLSPLDGVAAGYSMNTALSNVLGSGSTLPGDGSLTDGFNVFVPGGNAALRAGAVGGPVNVTTSPGDLVGPVGYGSSFSSGGNFSLTHGPRYGTGLSEIGTLSASASGYGAFDEPGQAPNANANGPNRGRAAQGQNLLTNPASPNPNPNANRPRQAPNPAASPRTRTIPARERNAPPPSALPRGEGRDTVPTAPAPTPDRQAPPQPREGQPQVPPPTEGEALDTLLEAVLGDWVVSLG